MAPSANAFPQRAASAIPALLECVHACTDAARLRDALPFVVGGAQVGLVMPGVARLLRRWPEVYRVGDGCIELIAGGDSVQARSDAVMETVLALRDAGDVERLRGWRGETWPVKASFHAEPCLLVERAAVPMFGALAFGSFVNGLCADDHLWIGRRSASKQTYPGRLDVIAAGGLSHGESPSTNVVKECVEEASIPPSIAARAVPAGLISYATADESGLGVKRDCCFVFDLELPATFVPTPHDGEVETFRKMHVGEVLDSLVSAPHGWKPNVCLVIIDLLVRRGYLSPDADGYVELVRALRQ